MAVFFITNLWYRNVLDAVYYADFMTGVYLTYMTRIKSNKRKADDEFTVPVGRQKCIRCCVLCRFYDGSVFDIHDLNKIKQTQSR